MENCKIYPITFCCECVHIDYCAPPQTISKIVIVCVLIFLNVSSNSDNNNYIGLVELIQGRSQEFQRGGAVEQPDPGIYLGVKPSSSIESWGRSPNRGRSPRKNEGEVWGGGSVNVSPEKFWKIELGTMHFGTYLRQTLKINDNMHGSRPCLIAYIHETIDIEYLMSGNCLILLNYETW